MKTTVKQIAATTLVALLFMAINVKAEGTETKTSSQANIETTLELENWMTDETVWNSNFVNNTEFVLETELELTLEDWMTSAESWDLGLDFAVEIESGLALEDWMTDSESWNGKYIFVVEVEPALEIEKWMISNRAWSLDNEKHKKHRSHFRNSPENWKQS